MAEPIDSGSAMRLWLLNRDAPPSGEFIRDPFVLVDPTHAFGRSGRNARWDDGQQRWLDSTSGKPLSSVLDDEARLQFESESAVESFVAQQLNDAAKAEKYHGDAQLKLWLLNDSPARSMLDGPRRFDYTT